MGASRNGEHIIGQMPSSSLERFVVQLCWLKLSAYRLVSEARNVKRNGVKKCQYLLRYLCVAKTCSAPTGPLLADHRQPRVQTAVHTDDPVSTPRESAWLRDLHTETCCHSHNCCEVPIPSMIFT